MKHLRDYLLMATLLCAFAWGETQAQIDYGMLVGTGTQMTGSFTTVQYGSRAGAGQSYDYLYPSTNSASIGFSFNFDGVNYTTAYISSNGFVSLGSSYGSPLSNTLNDPGAPILAPFWDMMRIAGGENPCGTAGEVRYMTTGTSPNRVFVVEWKDLALGDGWSEWGYAPVTFQLRLFETSNRIEFYYKEMSAQTPSCWTYWNTTMNTSGSIGISTDNGFLSVVPAGDAATTSKTNSNDNINLASRQIDDGVLYTFCIAGIYGDVSEGGTANMASGDTLINGIEVPLSGVETFQPFTLLSPCSGTYTYTISGPSAAEYSISPNGGSLPAAGSTPTLTFSPSTLGVRRATLAGRENLGFVVRTYNLAGVGVPRVSWIGNIADGGTASVSSGDTLMKNIYVYNGDTESFSPLTLEVAAGVGPPAPITYTLEDSTGQFSINRTSENIPMGGSSDLVITFSPTGVGPQLARLTVNAEGEIRKYVLLPFASGPGARFFINNEELAAGSSVFRNVYSCVGQDVQSVALRIESIGDEPFLLESSESYEVDGVVQQGRPNYPLLLDEFGDPIPVTDYFISTTPGSRTPLELPYAIQPGQSTTLYLNFLPTRPEKRRARAFFRSNGLNFFGLNTDLGTEQGILNFEFVGDGIGSTLSNPERTGLPKPIVFDPTEVRGTATATGSIFNNGECDLLINRDDFRIVSGDVSEFQLLGPIYGVSMNGNGEYVIPPGDTAMFDVSFTPIRSGSRGATVRVVTNDSTVYLPGVSERGVYYLDLYGKGNVGLEGRDVFIAPAVIDGTPSTGTAILENNSGGGVGITSIEILGTTEIIQDPARPWPSIPRQVNPGDRIELGLLLQPDAGSAPGVRTGTLQVTLDNGDVLILDLSGLAGTRLLSVVPSALFQGVSVDVGDIRRQFVALSNDGTLPVRITSIQVTGAGAADYSVATIDRGVIQAGGFEFIEVTYIPSAPGSADATLEIVTNSTNGTPTGTHTVALGGSGASTKFKGGPGGTPVVRPGLSAAEAAVQTAGGVALWQGTPNPTAADVAIRYFTPQQQHVVIELYTASGERVQTLLDTRSEGDQVLHADLGHLASGRYFYILHTGGERLTLPLDLVR